MEASSLPFHIAHGVLAARILEWFAIPSYSGPHFVRNLYYDLSWVALHSMAYSFIELCKPLRHDRAVTMMQRAAHWKRPWCQERMKAKGE